MPELEKAEKNEQELLFMDADHFIFATFMGYLWCISRIFLKSHAGRKRYNVLGALNSRTKKVSVFTNDTKLDGKGVCLFLKILYNEYRGKRIIIVLDNARYQRCRLVKICKASAYRITLSPVILPGPQSNRTVLEICEEESYVL